MLRTQTVLIFLCIYIKINAVPPEACFAKFRWEDCGKPPKRVLYYWKPGSRCEVGIWRGCLPNINMFHDEYECVSTCIFNARAQPLDYHILLEKEEEVDNKIDTTEAVSTVSSITDDTETATEGTEDTTVEPNATTVEVDVNATAVEVEANATTVEVEESATTVAVEVNATTVEAEANATTVEAEANATTVEAEANATTVEAEANVTTVEAAKDATEKVETNGTIAEGKGDPEETAGNSNETATNSTS